MVKRLKKFVRERIYSKGTYAGKLLWVDVLGFHLDFRKWYYSVEEYERNGKDWLVPWIPSWEINEQDVPQYLRPIPLVWQVAYVITQWRYRTPVKWMAVGYLACLIIKA